MRYFPKPVVIISMLSLCLLVFCFNSPMADSPEKDKKIITSVYQALSFLHYDAPEINDDFSKIAFENYMEAIDPFKQFFLKSDMAHFNSWQTKIDDDFKKGDLSFYYATIDTLNKRILEVEKFNAELFEKPFDLNNNQSLNLDFEKLEYPDKTQWKDLWKKQTQYEINQALYNLESDSLNQGKPLAELLKEATKEVKEDRLDYFRRIKEKSKKDLFSKYVNAITETFDPHTSYFSAKEKEDFDISISGQLEGIGAQLEDKRGYPTIKELIIGGPAWRSKELESGDQILKVAQENEEPVNIVGMLLDDAIRHIRGKKGTKVILTIKTKSGQIKQVTLVRDVIETGETFAKSTLITGENNQKYGLIHLPEFYVNLNDKNGRDASEDIAKEIKALKELGAQGLVFDVRGNGGGSLSEVVEIVGHFINKGPVVQVSRSDGEKDVLDDTVSGELWDGPLVILVDELSASASEIMAAALQDYKRALVVGSKQTYGKGTVQTVMPLDRFFKDSELGAIKLTIQKFYRVNGGSTQRKGVASDLVFPGKYSYLDINESKQKTALKWDQIPSAKYEVWKKAYDVNSLREKSKNRLSTNQEAQKLEAFAKWLKEMEDIKSISLNYHLFKKEMELRKTQSEKMEKSIEFDEPMTFSAPLYERAKYTSDSSLKAKREAWYKTLKQDFVLWESLHVLDDMKN
ncbi:MAG: tail-specific protease [Flavobacteriaceae bacterium]|nr:MAG: tail-specific protease [Flavobacteriaceae bacterium]